MGRLIYKTALHKWRQNVSNNLLGLPAFLVDVPRKLAGRAFRCNLFYFAKKADQKRMNLYWAEPKYCTP